MNNAKTKKPTLSGRDILFECGQCGKSLAIDGRGAGLNIHCPHCDGELEVPIPEGFDLDALDKEISDSVETVLEVKGDAVIQDGEQDISGGNEQIAALKAELESLRAQRRYLEQQHANMLRTINAVTREVGEFHKALDELSSLLDNLTSSQNDKTKKIE